MSKKILVIPDSHAHSDYHNDRFEWLGKLVVEELPDIIVDIGDSADMASLCHYDVGTLDAEGRRYKDDIKAYHNAMERFWKPINEHNDKLRKDKKKLYKPKCYITIGNHENRITKATIEDPKLYGHLSIDDLQHEKYGFERIEFLQPLVLEGICFKHFFTSGVMGRPIGGEHAAANTVKKGYMSCVSGHSHLRSFWETADAKGNKKFGLIVGCFFDYDPSYTKEHDRWWRGIVVLDNCKDGEADPRFISLESMKKKYG